MAHRNHRSSESEVLERLSQASKDFRVGQGPPARMTAAIRRRIRVRESFTLSVAVLGVGVLVIGGIALASGLPGGGTTAGGSGGTGDPNGRSSGGATPEPWPEVVVGGSEQPFIEASAGADGVDLPKQVVSYGTVSGVPWSLTGFWSDGGDSYSDAPGACAELFLGAEGEGGGTAICAEPVQKDAPSSSILRMSVLFSGANPGFVAYFGMVPSGAAQIQVRLSSGDVRTFDVLSDAKGLETGYFAFFAPPGIKGEVAVTDGTGSVLATQSLCSLPTADASETIGGECR